MLKKPKIVMQEPLQEFTDAEGDWIVCVLSQPNMKPKRAATLFLKHFDRFLETPVNKDDHPNYAEPYYPLDTIMYKLLKRFHDYRSTSGSAYYDRIKAKREVYNEMYRDPINAYHVTNLFEFIVYLEEVYLDIREFDRSEYRILKEGVKLRGELYQPKPTKYEKSGTQEKGWSNPLAGRSNEKGS